MALEILIGVWLLFAIATGMIGQSKGHGFGGYFVLGLLFGVLGLLIALCAKPRAQTVVAPAGWLFDPYRPGTAWMRYWDGTKWTDQEWRSPVASPWWVDEL